MDWFRHYVGTATDPKFLVVAKKSGARLGDVLAVWQMLLERACAAPERGKVEVFDHEGADALLDLEDGGARKIYVAMEDKGMISDGRIAAWEKRQPKRERDDDSSQRVKEFRERKKQESNDTYNNVTPCNATQRQETPRGEEIREEEIKKEKDSLALLPSAVREFDAFWQAYPKKRSKQQAQKAWGKLRKEKTLPPLPTILQAIAAAQAGHDWQKDGGQFIPHPATWINAHGWNDEPTQAAKTSGRCPAWL